MLAIVGKDDKLLLKLEISKSNKVPIVPLDFILHASLDVLDTRQWLKDSLLSNLDIWE